MNRIAGGRLLRHERLDGATGLAVDESLVESVAAGSAPPTLHLYSYAPCVLVGRYQNTAACLRLDRCAARGIEVNRRPTGGGTVFMTPDQLAMALIVPNTLPGLPRTIRGAFEFLAAPLAEALAQFGLEARFAGKNDLAVGGRKIAGLAISQDHEAATFFHVSLLLDFDLETMLDILNLPTHRMLDRGISCFGERMTTVRGELGRAVEWSELAGAVHRAIEARLGMSFVPGPFVEGEQETIGRLLRERYHNPEWIYAARMPRRRMGYAQRRTPGGWMQTHLAVSGGVIDTLLITGDYFSRTRDVAALESLLRWTAADITAVQKRMLEMEYDFRIHQVDLETMLGMIEEALVSARQEAAGTNEAGGNDIPALEARAVVPESGSAQLLPACSRRPSHD